MCSERLACPDHTSTSAPHRFLRHWWRLLGWTGGSWPASPVATDICHTWTTGTRWTSVAPMSSHCSFFRTIKSPWLLTCLLQTFSWVQADIACWSLPPPCRWHLAFTRACASKIVRSEGRVRCLGLTRTAQLSSAVDSAHAAEGSRWARVLVVHRSREQMFWWALNLLRQEGDCLWHVLDCPGLGLSAPQITVTSLDWEWMMEPFLLCAECCSLTE